MSKHTQLPFVSFPSSDSGSQVESKAKSRRLDFGSLLRSKKLGVADLSSKKRALDVDMDVGGKADNGNVPTSPSQRVKRTRLHSGVSVPGFSSPSRTHAPVMKTDLECRRSVDAPAKKFRPYLRERTNSASSVRTIRPTDAEDRVDSPLTVRRVNDKPYNVGPAEPAKPVLTDSDVNISKDAKQLDHNASVDKCSVNANEGSPGWLLSDLDGDMPSKETNYALKRLNSVEEFNPARVEVGNDPNSTTIAQECAPPDVSVKLFKQHIELWDTKLSDVYIYRAQMHMTSSLPDFDPCSPPNVESLEISCSSLFPSPTPEYITYYTGETTPGKRPQIDPSKGIHIGQRWWHSLPKEAGGTGVKGQWGWYLKMWIPIPMYVMRGREMGVFKVKTRVWMGNKNTVGLNKLNSEPLGAEKEFSVSCLRWTGKSFREPNSSRPPSGFLVPAWSLVTH